MVCGVVGVAFIANVDNHHHNTEHAVGGIEGGEGGGGGGGGGKEGVGGGSGSGNPVVRSRNKTWTGGCPDPMDIISAIFIASASSSSSSSTPQFPAVAECDSMSKPKVGYQTGTICKFFCRGNFQLRVNKNPVPGIHYLVS